MTFRQGWLEEHTQRHCWLSHLQAGPKQQGNIAREAQIHFPQGCKNTFLLFSVQGSGERSEGDRSCYRYNQLKLILSHTSELLDQCSKCSVIDAERGTAPGNQAGAAALHWARASGCTSLKPSSGCGVNFWGPVSFGVCFCFLISLPPKQDVPSIRL